MRASINGSVLEIVLDDTKTNNAFNLQKAETLARVFGSAKKEISLILISSKGRVFCSGGNLKDYANLKNKEAGLKVNRKIRKVLQDLAKHPALKVAAVSGDCLGGGIELLSCCDVIFAEPHVYFGMWQRKMSLSFGWGGFERLSEKMSSALLQKWLLTGDVHSAFWAEQQGLVDQILSETEIHTQFARLKTAATHDKDGSFAAVVKGLKKNEVALFEKLWWSKAHIEKLQKFGVKSKPS